MQVYEQHSVSWNKGRRILETMSYSFVIYIYITERDREKEREISFSVHEKGINIQENNHLFICEFIGKLERAIK